MQTFEKYFDEEFGIGEGIANMDEHRKTWNAACQACADALGDVPEACETPTGDSAISSDAAYEAVEKVSAL